MFGQFSRGSKRWTAAEQTDAAREQGFTIETARKAGHNRLAFTDNDGNRHFMLHSTVIASIENDVVTLRDGGWPSMTTRRAWGDALASFGGDARHLRPWTGKPIADHTVKGHPFNREITITTDGDLIASDYLSAPLMVRSTTADSEFGAIEVTYDGTTLRSSAGETIPLSPYHFIRLLRRIRVEIRSAGRDRLHSPSPSGNLYRGATDGFDAFGFHVCVEGFTRNVYVGCHAFRHSEIATALATAENRWPNEAAKTRKCDGAPKRKAA